MRGLDFDVDFLNERLESNEQESEINVCDDQRYAGLIDHCLSHCSPVSSDSGNHSPSSTSSEVFVWIIVFNLVSVGMLKSRLRFLWCFIAEFVKRILLFLILFFTLAIFYFD